MRVLEQTDITGKRVIRTAIYARYSSEMQSQYSADDQIDRAKSDVRKGRVHLVKYPKQNFELSFSDEWIVKDEAQSGRIASREGYNKILQGIREGAFDVLLVDDLTRLTRELGTQIHVYNLLVHYGVELFSLCDNISSESPNAKTYFQVKGLASDMDHAAHRARTKRGQEARVRKGFSAGDVCYGYRSEATEWRSIGNYQVPSHFKFVIHPDEAAVIIMIFDLKIAGWSYSRIAKHLNEKQIPSSERGFKRTNRRCNWSPSAVENILHNGKYIGVRKWGISSIVTHPETGKKVRKLNPEKDWTEHLDGAEFDESLVIVPIEKWKTVQAIITKNSRTAADGKDPAEKMRLVKTENRSGGDTLLAGILFCGECKSPMFLVTGRRGGYFGCSMHYRKDATRCNNNRTIRRTKLESTIIESLREIVLDPKLLQEAAQKMNELVKEKLRIAPDEVARLSRRQDELQQEIANINRFIRQCESPPKSTLAELQQAEEEFERNKSKTSVLKAAKLDNLLVTPFTLRAKYEKLPKVLEENTLVGNCALKDLFRNGLTCTPTDYENRKSSNPLKNLWNISGTLFVGTEGRFYDYSNGGSYRD